MHLKIVLQVVSVSTEPKFILFFKKKLCLAGLDAYEQQAVKLSCSRLQKLPCKWNGCSVIMNSVDALIRHLTRIHQPSPSLRIKVCLFFLTSESVPDLIATSRFYVGGPSVDDVLICERGI